MSRIVTATVLFTDPSGTPIPVVGASADVFYFDDTGSKVWVIPPASPMSDVVGDTGRYTVSFDPPVGVRTSYATMYGIDPSTGMRVVAEQQVVQWR